MVKLLKCLPAATVMLVSYFTTLSLLKIYRSILKTGYILQHHVQCWKVTYLELTVWNRSAVLKPELVFQPFMLRWATKTAKQETRNAVHHAHHGLSLWTQTLPCLYLHLSLYICFFPRISSLLWQALGVAWLFTFVCVWLRTWLAWIKTAGTQGDAETYSTLSHAHTQSHAR